MEKSLALAYSPFICMQLQITSSVAAYGKNCNETRARQAQMNGLSLASEKEILLYSNMKWNQIYHHSEISSVFML